MKRKQWASWGPGEQPEQHYLIEPRALAGGGDIRHVSEYLRASGWRDRSKKDGPLTLESPDRTIRISYDPYIQPGGWAIRGAARGHQAEWWATLGRQTPVEIVAGLTDALTQPRSAHAPDVWAPLKEQRWQLESEGRHYTATSRDGSAWLHFRQDAQGNALWWSGAGDPRQRLERPVRPHHPDAPRRCLLRRARQPGAGDAPPRTRPHTTKIRTTSVSVLPSQLSAWQQARITAARAATWARSWNANRPRTAPRPTPRRRHRARR
ncbi:DUF317 domain-containing protein [Streptomyces mirabilis]|nr:DUF317 domain-containing protein [Streptomyces mirabilis]